MALNQPIAHINANHSTPFTKTIDPDGLSELQPVISIIKGAKVMLTMKTYGQLLVFAMVLMAQS